MIRFRFGGQADLERHLGFGDGAFFVPSAMMPGPRP